MIEIVPDATFEVGAFAAVIESANSYQDGYTFTLREGFGKLNTDDYEEIRPTDAFEQLAEKEWFDREAYYILVSQRRLEDNFFSKYVGRVTILSLSNWAYLTSAPLQAGLLDNLIIDVLRSSNGDHRFHQETRGCPFDFTAMKSDIDVGLKRAALCQPCRQEFERILMPEDLEAVLHLLDLLGFYANTGRLPRSLAAANSTEALLPFVPNTTAHYNPTREANTRLEAKYQALVRSREVTASGQQRGESLESFCKELFSLVEGFELYDEQTRLNDCEIDLSYRVETSMSELHRALGPMAFIRV